MARALVPFVRSPPRSLTPDRHTHPPTTHHTPRAPATRAPSAAAAGAAGGRGGGGRSDQRYDVSSSGVLQAPPSRQQLEIQLGGGPRLQRHLRCCCLGAGGALAGASADPAPLLGANDVTCPPPPTHPHPQPDHPPTPAPPPPPRAAAGWPPRPSGCLRRRPAADAWRRGERLWMVGRGGEGGVAGR